MTTKQAPDYEQARTLPMEELRKLAMESYGQPGQPAAEAAQAPPEQREAPEQPEAAPAPEQQQELFAHEPASQVEEAEPARQEQRGNPEVPLREARERARQAEEARQATEAHRMALEQQHRQLLEALQDPERVRAHLASIAPAPPPDYDDDPQGAIQHHLAPLNSRLEALENENKALKTRELQRQQMEGFAQKYGPSFLPTLQAFDQKFPHFQQLLAPDARYALAVGEDRIHRNPAEDEAQIAARIQSEAKAQAVDKVAEVLGGAKPSKAITTLGGAPQAKHEEGASAVASMSHDDRMRQSQDTLRNSLRNLYGG